MSKPRLLITGASSMIGQHIQYVLLGGNYDVYCSSHSTHDLLNLNECIDLFNSTNPDYVINLSGYNGNLDFSKRYPADIFYRTSQLALNVLNCCQQYKVKKVVNIISSCSLPDNVSDTPMKAEDLWNGLPNETIECHGLAKRVLHAYSRQLYKQYGLKSICVILNNNFGENDSFDINKTKCVAGIIKRVVDAYRNNLPSIKCWGSGEVYREFVYAGDSAKCIIQALEKYDDVMTPLNISSPDEITIKELTNKIANIVGYKGTIEWDTSKPDGQKKKSLDTTIMRNYIDIEFTQLDKAIADTIHWYKRSTAGC